MTAAFLFVYLPHAPQGFDLRVRPIVGKPIVLNALEERSEGSSHTTLGTRIQVVGEGPLAIGLTTGPFSSGGRTFGRPKTSRLRLTPLGTVAGDAANRPPFLLAVPVPAHPVKVGDTWTGTFVGPTPMPAGVKATFRALGPVRVAGAPCLRIGMKIDTEMGGARITGSGTSALRLDDGIVQAGSLTALLVYHRPNPVTRKMEESSRVNVKATIGR